MIVIPATFPTVLFQVSVQFLSTLLHVFFHVGKTTFKAASFTLAVSESLNITLFKLYLVCFSQGSSPTIHLIASSLTVLAKSQRSFSSFLKPFSNLACSLDDNLFHESKFIK